MSGTYFMSQMVVSVVRLSRPVRGSKVLFEAQKGMLASCLCESYLSRLVSCAIYIANNNLNRSIGNLDVGRNKVRLFKHACGHYFISKYIIKSNVY